MTILRPINRLPALAAGLVALIVVPTVAEGEFRPARNKVERSINAAEQALSGAGQMMGKAGCGAIEQAELVGGTACNAADRFNLPDWQFHQIGIDGNLIVATGAVRQGAKEFGKAKVGTYLGLIEQIKARARRTQVAYQRCVSLAQQQQFKCMQPPMPGEIMDLLDIFGGIMGTQPAGCPPGMQRSSDNPNCHVPRRQP